jgi:hypothetical protein
VSSHEIIYQITFSFTETVDEDEFEEVSPEDPTLEGYISAVKNSVHPIDLVLEEAQNNASLIIDMDISSLD